MAYNILTLTQEVIKMNIQKLESFLQTVAVVVPMENEEAMRVDFIDDEEHSMYVTGEESGEQYYIDLNDFEPSEYMFYELKQTSFDYFLAANITE
jgi:hypothetical protein